MFRVVVDFALKKMNSLLGVSMFRYTVLADDVKAVLPTVEELQKEMLSDEREQFNKVRVI